MNISSLLLTHQPMSPLQHPYQLLHPQTSPHTLMITQTLRQHHLHPTLTQLKALILFQTLLLILHQHHHLLQQHHHLSHQHHLHHHLPIHKHHLLLLIIIYQHHHLLLPSENLPDTPHFQPNSKIFMSHYPKPKPSNIHLSNFIIPNTLTITTSQHHITDI